MTDLLSDGLSRLTRTFCARPKAIQRSVHRDSTLAHLVSLSREPKRAQLNPGRALGRESSASTREALRIAIDNMDHCHAWCKRLDPATTYPVSFD